MSIQIKSCSNCGHTPKVGLRCQVCGALGSWYPFEIAVVIGTLLMVLLVCVILSITGTGAVLALNAVAQASATAQANVKATQTVIAQVTGTSVAIPTATYQAQQTRQAMEANQSAKDVADAKAAADAAAIQNNQSAGERAKAEAALKEAEAKKLAEENEAKRLAAENKACDPAHFMVYTVKEANWLSKLSATLYDDATAYGFIMDATNNAHEIDTSFTKITDPNRIEIDDKLCVPLNVVNK